MSKTDQKLLGLKKRTTELSSAINLKIAMNLSFPQKNRMMKRMITMNMQMNSKQMKIKMRKKKTKKLKKNVKVFIIYNR